MNMQAVHIAAGILSIVITVLITKWFTKRRIIGKIDFMSDALSSGDTAFRYHQGSRLNRQLNTSLNRLRAIFEADKREIREREHWFGLMLDQVRSGVLVLEGDKITYSNAIAKGFLGISQISSIRQVRRLAPELADAFTEADENERNASFSSERGTIQFSVSACETFLNGRALRIITFNDITRDMENNETESWTRLIRVLTHEIMNTVTPIASLSSALATGLDDYSSDEVKSALGTIASSSEGLISFVNSYRSLTHIAVPVMKAFYFRELAENAINIARAGWPEVDVSFTEKSDDVILYADQGQLSQVVNNLVKNAIQAGAGRIEITAEIDKRDRTVINVINDGEPISKSSQEQLFVPFYTTKGKGGTGVGLSLSRQMVRLNNGQISLSSSVPGRTVFTLIF